MISVLRAPSLFEPALLVLTVLLLGVVLWGTRRAERPHRALVATAALPWVAGYLGAFWRMEHVLDDLGHVARGDLSAWIARGVAVGWRAAALGALASAMLLAPLAWRDRALRPLWVGTSAAALLGGRWALDAASLLLLTPATDRAWRAGPGSWTVSIGVIVLVAVLAFRPSPGPAMIGLALPLLPLAALPGARRLAEAAPIHPVADGLPRWPADTTPLARPTAGCVLSWDGARFVGRTVGTPSLRHEMRSCPGGDGASTLAFPATAWAMVEVDGSTPATVLSDANWSDHPWSFGLLVDLASDPLAAGSAWRTAMDPWMAWPPEPTEGWIHLADTPPGGTVVVEGEPPQVGGRPWLGHEAEHVGATPQVLVVFRPGAATTVQDLVDRCAVARDAHPVGLSCALQRRGQLASP